MTDSNAMTERERLFAIIKQAMEAANPALFATSGMDEEMRAAADAILADPAYGRAGEQLRHICEYVALFHPDCLPSDSEMGFDVRALLDGGA